MIQKINYRILTRTALLLALTILFQSLRLIIPLPPYFSTLMIGSLVNTCLLVALQTIGLSSALVLVVITPVVAYFQQLLPLPLLIIPVALGNAIYVLLYRSTWRLGQWPAVGLAALGKMTFMYIAFTWLLTFIAIPPKLAAGLMFNMSWPQFVTGVIGGLLAEIVVKRIRILS